MTEVRCRLCQSTDLELAWNLAPSPYGDLFREVKSEAQALSSVELTLVLCSGCTLLQITQDVNVDEVYRDYLYQSSVTSGLSMYYSRLASRLTLDLNLSEEDLVIDVGSNDGTGLQAFRRQDLRVLGIEPSSAPAAAAMVAGIPTVNEFLNSDSVSECLRDYGQAQLVCANYVSANVRDPLDFFRNCKSLMKAGAALSVITGYHPDQFAVNMFDYVNHDHLSYFSVRNAVRLAAACGLTLTGVERVDHKGGSVHMVFRHSDFNSSQDESVGMAIQREQWLGVGNIGPYRALAERVNAAAVEFEQILDSRFGGKIAGVGASISTTHLLCQFGIGPRIGQLFDDDPNKIGRFSPGWGISVAPMGELNSNDWDCAVILAWQHSDVLIGRLRAVGYHGEVVIPLPNPSIIQLT
jgi:hypothetical protein